MIIFLTIINILNYLDRYLVASVLPVLTDHFTLTNEEAGRLTSAFVIGYALFSPIFGYLGDRFRRPLLMAVGIFLWSLATVYSGLAGTYMSFFAARVFVGIGEASFGTIAPGYIKDYLKNPIKVNGALSIFFSAIPVGAALGYVIGGSVASRYDWHTAFFVGGAPGLILAFILFFFLKDVRSAPPEKVNMREGLASIFSKSLLWFAIGGYILNAFALNGIAAFVVKHGMGLGFELEPMNQYFGGILLVTGFLGTAGGGALSSWFAKRSRHSIRSLFMFTALSAILASPFLVGAFLVESKELFLALCFFAQLLIFAGVAPVNSIIVLLSPEKYVTLTQGVTILSLNLLGTLAGPIVVGLVADFSSLRYGLTATSVAMALAGVTWYLGANRSTKEVII